MDEQIISRRIYQEDQKEIDGHQTTSEKRENIRKLVEEFISSQESINTGEMLPFHCQKELSIMTRWKQRKEVEDFRRNMIDKGLFLQDVKKLSYSRGSDGINENVSKASKQGRILPINIGTNRSRTKRVDEQTIARKIYQEDQKEIDGLQTTSEKRENIRKLVEEFMSSQESTETDETLKTNSSL